MFLFSYVSIKNTSKQHIYKKKVNMKIYFSSKNNLDLQRLFISFIIFLTIEILFYVKIMSVETMQCNSM